MDSRDTAVRARAFEFLNEQRMIHGDILPVSVLRQGFVFQGDRVPLVSPQGIFKPRAMDLPLSITTVPPSHKGTQPYDDQVSVDGLLLYRYRGNDPDHPDNAGLREVMRRQLPLAYFYGIIKSRYYPICPVFIPADNPASLTFSVAVDDAAFLAVHNEIADSDAEARRRYITTVVQHRVHQQGFRERVLDAYRNRCAICRLRHPELLEAAHILPDGHPKGDPVVPNGLSLCKLHHAAFDGNFLGVRPDYVIELRHDILDEHDGPMLQYGIQAFHGARLQVPRPPDLKPDRERLGERYDLFRRSA